MKKNLPKLLTPLAMSVLLMAGVNAHAVPVLLDFDSLNSADNNFNFGATYSEDGFTFTDGTANLSTFGSNDGSGRWTGSAALFTNTPNAIVTLTNDAGAAFSLSSIDISELNFAGGVRVSFLGTLLGGGTVEQIFDTDGPFGLQTFNFNAGFTNLISVQWAQVSPFHQIDNIVADVPVDVISVPEPGTIALFAIGLAGIGLQRRKKKV